MQSHPQAEHWAVSNLTRIGYVTYLPLCLVRRRDRTVRSIVHTVTAPLFPGYLFVRLSPADPWTPVRYAQGVRQIVALSSGRPTPCPDAAVEALQAGDALRATPLAPDALWRPGAACCVADGPMRGFPGVVQSVSGDVATVQILVFGALRNLRVRADCLMARE